MCVCEIKMALWLQMNMKVFIGKMTWYLEFAFKMSQQNKMLGVVVIKNDENKWWFLSPKKKKLYKMFHKHIKILVLK